MGCGERLSPGLQVVAADSDQAFEACSSSGVGQAWLQIAERFSDQLVSNRILVRKRKKFFKQAWGQILRTRLVGPDAGPNSPWACCGNGLQHGHCGALTFGLVGISIGGTMSGAAVSIHLAAEENSGKHRLAHSSLYPFPADQFPSFINWIRYVDDLLAASLCYCPSCILVCLRSVFAENHIIMLQLSCLD